AAEPGPPGPAERRENLVSLGVAEAFLPTRLEIVGALPRDDRGRLRREALRSWLTRLRPGTPRPTPT
ncbi:hypothetical protein ACFVZX_27400, partial [Streptomyces erythrochromogenes]